MGTAGPWCHSFQLARGQVSWPWPGPIWLTAALPSLRLPTHSLRLCPCLLFELRESSLSRAALSRSDQQWWDQAGLGLQATPKYGDVGKPLGAEHQTLRSCRKLSRTFLGRPAGFSLGLGIREPALKDGLGHCKSGLKWLFPRWSAAEEGLRALSRAPSPAPHPISRPLLEIEGFFPVPEGQPTRPLDKCCLCLYGRRLARSRA